MGSLYPYSLLPVLSVALLLFFTAARRGPLARGLSAYCFFVALWSSALLLLWFPGASPYAERSAAVGAFIAAAFLHAAYDLTRQRSYLLVALAYLVALSITLAGAAWPGLIYGPRAMVRGPFFWPVMALAVAAAVVPLWHLYRAYREAPAHRKGPLVWLFVAGVLGYSGGMSNAVLLSQGLPLPFGMLLVLASLLVLANVLRDFEPPSERRLLERSLLYSAIAAFLSAGFLFGVMSLAGGAEPFLAEHRVGALFLLFTAALAFEPLRTQILEALGRRFVARRVAATEVSRALEAEAERAAHAERLAEIGVLTSAVAHEVRNPLGVLAAYLKVIERRGTTPDTLTAMREQIDRASRFVDDLLRYGRPRPIELRLVDMRALVELAVSTARQGAGFDTSRVEIGIEHDSEESLVEADQAQLSQVLVILVDNALLSVADRGTAHIVVRTKMAAGRAAITVEDDGPGVPEAILGRLFSPFVTGRKREGPRPGTGLGLAIARGIVERHHGRIAVGRSALGGARFEVSLPKVQPVLT